MKTFATLVAVVPLVLVGCGDGPTEPSPTTVVSIIVSAPSPTMTVGETMTATARLLNSDGKDVTGKSPNWSSSNPAVATVDQSGRITAVGPGTATITARADNATGDWPLGVDVDRCQTPLTLNPAQVAILSGPAAVSCIRLGASTAASQYIFIAANASQTRDQVGPYSVVLEGSTTATVSPSAAVSVSPSLASAIAIVEARDEAEDRIRAAERRVLRAFPRVQLQRWRGDAPRMSASVAGEVAALAVGDTLPFRVPDVFKADLCNNYFSIRGVVKAVGQRAQVVQDVNAPANGLTNADFAAIATEFDNVIYRTDTEWFGTPTDINRDNRVTILYTPEVNKFTPRDSDSFIGGFFWGGDLFTQADYQAANITCPQTNEQEIFYLLAADPNGEFGDPRSTTDVRQTTRGTIAHELQHMINQGVRQFNPNADLPEVDWLNEGLSHLAEEAVGRASRGFGDFQSLSASDVRANPDDFRAYFAQNLARFASYLARPDTASPTSDKADRQLAPRGAAWAFLRYVADQFAPGDARTFFRRLVAGPDTSITNLVAKAGVPFDQIISGWLIANYADDVGISGLDQRYTYRSWNMRDAVATVNNGTYPLQVRPLGASPIETQALSGSGNYFRVQRDAGAPQATFRMVSPGGGNVSFSGARVYVLRHN